MAVLRNGRCRKCGKDFQTTVSSGGGTPNLCDKCRLNELDKQRRLHFQGLDGLTIKERLRRIEEWIYDYKPRHEPRF